MQIRKNVWHYHLYQFTYFFTESGAPSKTSLCQYVRRLFLLTVPVAAAVLAVIIFCCLCVMLMTIWNIVAGQGLTIINLRGEGPVIGLKPFGYISVSSYPFSIEVIVKSLWCALLAGSAIWYLGPALIKAGVNLIQGSGIVFLIFALIFGVIIGCLIIYIIIRGIRHSESWKLFKSYLKARKDGICPVVTFE